MNTAHSAGEKVTKYRAKKWNAYSARRRFEEAFAETHPLPACARQILLLHSNHHQPFDAVITFTDGSKSKLKIFDSKKAARHYRKLSRRVPFITVSILFEHDHGTVRRNVYTQLGSFYATQHQS